jgi:hypothetical protein
MTSIIRNMIRGIRSPIPSGYVIGRTDPGTGEVHLISLKALGTAQAAAGGGGGGTNYTAGAGIGIASGVISNTGGVTAGAGITVVPGGAISNTGVLSVTAGTNVAIGGTAANPIINASGGGGGPTALSFSSTVLLNAGSFPNDRVYQSNQSFTVGAGGRLHASVVMRARTATNAPIALITSAGTGWVGILTSGPTALQLFYTTNNGVSYTQLGSAITVACPNFQDEQFAGFHLRLTPTESGGPTGTLLEFWVDGFTISNAAAVMQYFDNSSGINAITGGPWYVGAGLTCTVGPSNTDITNAALYAGA